MSAAPRAMSARFCVTGVRKTLQRLVVDELSANVGQVRRYGTSDWSESEKDALISVLNEEADRVGSIGALAIRDDSVNGDDEMPIAYSGYGDQKVDVVTQLASGRLVLSEAKFVVKIDGLGPFGGPGSFRSRISDKFLDVYKTLEADGEAVDAIRIIVVTKEQLQLSIAHVHGLLDGGYPSGTFSSDRRQYDYVLCTSANLRDVIDNPPRAPVDTQDYFFFSI